MRACLLIAATLVAAIALQAAPSAAQSYDAFRQYSIKKNPNGPWSYVAAGQLLTAKTKKCNGIKKDYCWTNGETNFPDVAADEANKTHKTIQYADVILPQGYLDFDPEGVASVAFQWTAPASGTAHVTGNFLGVATNEGSHEVAVLQNGQVLTSFTISAYQQNEKFKLNVTVAAGDTIAFTSYTGNGGGALSTGLKAKIVMR